MKRCPQCRRDYFDETLLYCLDDGSALLEGPAGVVEPDDEPVTATLSEPLASGGGASGIESATRPQMHKPSTAAGEPAQKTPGFDKRLIMAPIALAVILLGGFFVYRDLIPARQIESIAVMPFVNESGNAEVEYLSDGMTDTLINSLSQVPNLNVKARSSVFRYKGKETDPKTIAADLSVQAILNGRVVQRGEALTLYLELVDAQTGNAIWGDRYDRRTSDLIALQGQIARDVSQKLRAKLSGADEQKLRKTYTENVEAYQLYLKGRYHVFRLTPPEVQKSITYFQSAIDIDPTYALAYAGLSDAYRSLALAGEMDPNETLPRSKAAANRAIEIDDNLAEAHTALGICLFWYDWNWTASEDQFKRALELDPNSGLTHLYYAHLLSNIGRNTEALMEAKRAREIEPLSPFVSALEGQFLLHAGRTDEAIERLRLTSELDPNFYFPHHFAASTYIEKGMFAEALVSARRAKELGPDQTVATALTAFALAKLGKHDEAQAVLDELLERSARRWVPPYQIAFAYQGLGETEKALAYLEKGYQARDPKMAFLKVEPKWKDLRPHPRFQELMKKMGFP
jgi:serine/threonine-protein kinase